MNINRVPTLDGVTDGVTLIVGVIDGVTLIVGVTDDVGVGDADGGEQHPSHIVVNVPPVNSAGICTEPVNAQKVVVKPEFSTTKWTILS